jgi:type IV pilus assembly protein PilB
MENEKENENNEKDPKAAPKNTENGENAEAPVVDPNFVKINLASYLIDESLINSVPGAIVKKHKFMPVFKIGDTLTIATAEPDNLTLLDDITKGLGIEIDALYADPKDIENAIKQHYGVMDLIETFVDEVSQDKTIEEVTDDSMDVSTEKMEDSAVVNLVNLIIGQALLKRASDIHIEPLPNESLVRLRVDGELFEMKRMPKRLHGALVSRIKVIAGMDIAETRIPQDGHIKITIDRKEVELRVSSLPMIYGENLVLRLLPKGDIIFGMQDLGFSDSDMLRFNKLIYNPYGMFLVTGPTGSGKTTTLYAALNEVNQTTRNIITLEDPVEHQIPLIRQVQINPKAGLTFSTGLRSILRQDPDVIMVGEIRDLETAELAIRSALTGHLLLSTIHTNDAPSTLIRLTDMGIEPFLVSSAIIGVLAQRLVRKNCPKCSIEYKPTQEELVLLNLDPNHKYVKGRGCKTCSQSGFLGRIGIFELLVLDETIKNILLKNASANEMRKLAIEAGFKTMKEDGIEKINDGLTTPAELLKVIQFLERK